jgi:hypothetical protein
MEERRIASEKQEAEEAREFFSAFLIHFFCFLLLKQIINHEL